MVASEKPNYRHCRLLRARRERPRGRRATEQRSVMNARRFNHRIAFGPRQPGPACRISNWRRSVSGYRSASRASPSSAGSIPREMKSNGRSLLGYSSRVIAQHPTDRAVLFTWRRYTVIEYRSAWLQMSSYLALPWQEC